MGERISYNMNILVVILYKYLCNLQQKRARLLQLFSH